jgi:hypothetical protein
MLLEMGVAVQKNRENEGLQQLQGVGETGDRWSVFKILSGPSEYRKGTHTFRLALFRARTRASRTTESKTAYGWRICADGVPPIRLNVLA